MNESSSLHPSSNHSKEVWRTVGFRFDTLRNLPWLTEGVAIIGGILYFVQSLRNAHGLDSILDEGAYLFKGYLFATGQYVPFQDYGLWTNKMPLSFLLPGYIQLVFGPGVRTGRYFAVFLGLLILFGLWLLAKRLGNRL